MVGGGDVHLIDGWRRGRDGEVFHQTRPEVVAGGGLAKIKADVRKRKKTRRRL